MKIFVDSRGNRLHDPGLTLPLEDSGRFGVPRLTPAALVFEELRLTGVLRLTPAVLISEDSRLRYC